MRRLHVSFRCRESMAYIPLCSFQAGLQQIAQRAEIEVQIALFQPKMLGQLPHAALQLEEGVAEALDLLVAERAVVHPAQRLPLHELPEQLDEREHELGETLLDLLGIGVHSPGKGLRQVVERAGDPAQVPFGLEQLPDQVRLGAQVDASVPANEYAAHGPVHTTDTSGDASARLAASLTASVFWASTRKAALISPRVPRWSVVWRASEASGSCNSATNRSCRRRSSRRVCMYSAPVSASAVLVSVAKARSPNSTHPRTCSSRSPRSRAWACSVATSSSSSRKPRPSWGGRGGAPGG